MFFLKKQVLVFDSFTTDSLVADMFPISKATKHYPEFWNQLDNYYIPEKAIEKRPTMKTCAGFYDYYLNGFILPLWSDLTIETRNNEFYWQFSNTNNSAQYHDYQQRKGFLPNYFHLKLNSIWALKGKKDISWAISQPIWNFNNNLANLIIPPAIAEYKYQHGLDINIFMPMTKEKRTYELFSGQPLMHLAPMTDKKVKIITNVVSQNEFNKVVAKQTVFSFLNKYKKYKTFAKTNKCPFSS
jgi:hypothetical protein